MAVLKILELVGTPKQSWSDAAREAVNEAAKTVRGIETVEVAQSKAVVQNNKLTEYQVLVRIGSGSRDPSAPRPERRLNGRRTACSEACLARAPGCASFPSRA